MIVYRLAKAAYRALDGEGARLHGVRWNSLGRPMVYAAANAALAVLEVLVHLDLPVELMPDDYRIFVIDVPDEAPMEMAESAMDMAVSQAAGDAFLIAGVALGLVVPSIVVPQERNLLLNPRHPDMARVRVIDETPFAFDPRLVGA